MMNRIFLSLVAFFSIISVFATDYNMVILKNDGSKIVVPTADIEKVYFEESSEIDDSLRPLHGLYERTIGGMVNRIQINSDGTGYSWFSENPSEYETFTDYKIVDRTLYIKWTGDIDYSYEGEVWIENGKIYCTYEGENLTEFVKINDNDDYSHNR